jgi:hypothetical protein
MYNGLILLYIRSVVNARRMTNKQVFIHEAFRCWDGCSKETRAQAVDMALGELFSERHVDTTLNIPVFILVQIHNKHVKRSLTRKDNEFWIGLKIKIY